MKIENLEKCTYDGCIEELNALLSLVRELETRFAEREVQGEILERLKQVQKILNDVQNDVADIMGGNNPYA